MYGYQFFAKAWGLYEVLESKKKVHSSRLEFQTNLFVFQTPLLKVLISKLFFQHVALLCHGVSQCQITVSSVLVGS